MKLLLDTCTFLWVITDDDTLSPASKTVYSDTSNEVFLSAVSVWEIMVKFSLGRLHLPIPFDQFMTDQRDRHGIMALPLEEHATLHLPKLPSHHRDPFDRMLICQAIHHELTIVTPDEHITQYPVRAFW